MEESGKQSKRPKDAARRVYTSVKRRFGRLKSDTKKLAIIIRYCMVLPLRAFSKKRYWLIDERIGMSAEDNSYHFFRYIRRHHPEIPIYYIIDSQSDQRACVEPYGHVVTLYSWRHLVLLAKSNVLISTDSFQALALPFELVPVLCHDTVNVFLQHGVSGNKTMTYYKSRHPLFNLVITSNEREKKIFIDTYGFGENEVAVTGCARFDALDSFRRAESSRIILIAPTWRKWLKGIRKVETSKYYYYWVSLLENEHFLALLDRHDITVYFQPHFNMIEKMEAICARSPRIKIMNKGNPIQELIIKADMLVTDYSSVMYDFYFQKKPVVNFMFDRIEWERQLDGPPLVDFDHEFADKPVTEITEVIKKVDEYIEKKFEISDKSIEKMRSFFTFEDSENCKRIFDAITRKFA